LLYSFKSLIERVDNKPNPAKVQQKSSHWGKAMVNLLSGLDYLLAVQQRLPDE
jgi:hypothetical protein